VVDVRPCSLVGSAVVVLSVAVALLLVWLGRGLGLLHLLIVACLIFVGGVYLWRRCCILVIGL